MTPRRSRQTAVVELTETHNICLAIKRVQDQAGGYDPERWKRAVYHALGMAHVGTDVLQRVREALRLP